MALSGTRPPSLAYPAKTLFRGDAQATSNTAPTQPNAETSEASTPPVQPTQVQNRLLTQLEAIFNNIKQLFDQLLSTLRQLFQSAPSQKETSSPVNEHVHSVATPFEPEQEALRPASISEEAGNTDTKTTTQTTEEAPGSPPSIAATALTNIEDAPKSPKERTTEKSFADLTPAESDSALDTSPEHAFPASIVPKARLKQTAEIATQTDEPSAPPPTPEQAPKSKFLEPAAHMKKAHKKLIEALQEVERQKSSFSYRPWYPCKNEDGRIWDAPKHTLGNMLTLYQKDLTKPLNHLQTLGESPVSLADALRKNPKQLQDHIDLVNDAALETATKHLKALEDYDQANSGWRWPIWGLGSGERQLIQQLREATENYAKAAKALYNPPSNDEAG